MLDIHVPIDHVIFLSKTPRHLTMTGTHPILFRVFELFPTIEDVRVEYFGYIPARCEGKGCLPVTDVTNREVQAQLKRRTISMV